MKGSIRLNVTFFTWSYKKAQQMGERQLQPSARQLTGDLAQQRFLPRCPSLFLTWSLCCSTPPVSPDGFTGIVLVVPIKLFIWLFKRRWRRSVPTLNPGNLCWVDCIHFVIRIAQEKDSVMQYKWLPKEGKVAHTYSPGSPYMRITVAAFCIYKWTQITALYSQEMRKVNKTQLTHFV